MQARFKNSYLKAPFYSDIFPLVEKCLASKKTNLFDFIFDSIKVVCAYLEIKTEFVVSSEISINENLRGKERVTAICKDLVAKTYINPIGGTSLYNKEDFTIKTTINSK